MSDGKVVFEIVGDSSGIEGSIRNVTSTIRQESKKWDDDASTAMTNVGSVSESVSGTMSAAFEGAFIAITAGIMNATADILKAIGEWAIAAIDMASDLEEVQNVVDVTFGEAGAQKIDDWAKKAGTQFGLTELQAKKFTSTLGAMMKSSGLTGDQIVGMSTDLAGLAADMASFYNLDFDTAFQKIRSGLSGETEPLKQLGINMSVDNLNAYLESMGSEAKFGDLGQAEQLMTRYQYMLQATADAQGDFVRTSGDSYANMGRQIETQAANLQQAAGEKLLPIAKEFREDWLNFLKLLNGDNSVAVTGSESQLTQWINEASQAAEDARTNLDALADQYGYIVDMDRESFEPGIYKSYGEFLLATLQTQQMFAGGRQRERIDEAVAAMEGEAEKIQEAEAKVADYQKQLDQLATEAPDGTQAGSDVVSGIVTGMESQEGNLQAEVDNINAILSGIGTGAGSGNWFSSFVGGLFLNGEHETGLDFVPFDNYLASLHEGEGVLTAEENRIWQRFKNGQSNGLDYEALGGVMRDNVHAGGNVYLDGRTVGSVISDIQGSSYRKLQRSGWQS